MSDASRVRWLIAWMFALVGMIGFVGSASADVFTETFDDKSLSRNEIRDKSGNAVWKINQTEGQTYHLVDGALELGGARYMQRAELQDQSVTAMDDLAMEFTVNIQRMGNEGHSGRPMIAIIPRTKDANYEQYYAVTYYLETTYLGNIVANLYKAHWAIVNTAAPSGMEPLAEGYFLLEEDVDYTARLTVENTTEGDVHLAFYLDGPTSPQHEYKPLLSYTDRSPYKIISSAAGPALGMSGRMNDIWGPPPKVRFDDIRIMEWPEYERYAKQLEQQFSAAPIDLAQHAHRDEIHYILNRGWMELAIEGRFQPNSLARTADFLASLRSISRDELMIDEEEGLLSKQQAAHWIYKVAGEPRVRKAYTSILSQGGKVDDSIHYVFEQGIMGLDDNGSFEVNRFLTREDVALLLLRLTDNGYRFPHGSIQLPPIFSSNSVLQRDKPIPVWGTGTSGEKITVRFREQEKTTNVVDGHWMVELEPEAYGGPDPLIIEGLKERIVLSQVLVGDVFVVAGQSNAEMELVNVNDGDQMVERFKNDPQLRIFKPDQVMGASPRYHNEGAWMNSLDWVLEYAPAIGVFAVAELMDQHEELKDVPIGLIQITYGGSTIELFLPDTFIKEHGYVQQHDEPIMSGYWNGYMNSISPYAVKAWLYYQGENSTQLGYSYEPLLRGYLSAVREEFKDPKLPVYLVQLAGYGDNYYESDLDSWPIIREVQMRVARTTPNTELVSAIDLSDEDPLEIHPRDKKEIGQRLAYRIVEQLYGEKLLARSPELAQAQLVDGVYNISFDYVDQHLIAGKAWDEGRTGFEMLDVTGKWLPAQAEVTADGQGLKVWREGLSEPQGVRYAWRNYPQVTLFDASGLPVLPFNTTKDLNTIPEVQGTDSQNIRIMNHFLSNYDAIVNLSRDNAFRMIEVRDGHLLWHEYAIPGQTAGDWIARLSRLENVLSQAGTTNTVIRMRDHGLAEGDWIRNNTRGWQARRVMKVIDAHTFEVVSIDGQSVGDEIERYVLQGISLAMGDFKLE